VTASWSGTSLTTCQSAAPDLGGRRTMWYGGVPSPRGAPQLSAWFSIRGPSRCQGDRPSARAADKGPPSQDRRTGTSLRRGCLL